MESGNVVEFIDRQKIICAVILEVKKQRLRLLTETNREVNISAGRLAHAGGRLDVAMGRYKMVSALKGLATRREGLADRVDIQELWEVLNSEQEWIDLKTMIEFCFPDAPDSDQGAAVVRAFFKDRKYFKFNADRFFPYTEEQVEQIVARQKETERRNRIIEEGGDWLKKVLKGEAPEVGGGALTGDK
ncbi:MAG: exoribonuclease II, partial [Desulfobacterales bacterium]|nr:exoribonuclease II [Desulfobacterales bacterium]